MPTALPPHLSRLLTSSQQTKVADLVRLHHYALIIELMGDKAVPPHILTQVKSKGMYRKPRPDVIHRSFVFGKAGIVDDRVLELDEDGFSRYLDMVGLVLTRHDREALSHLRRSFTHYLNTLAEDLVAKVESAVIKADKKLQRKLAQKQRRALFMEIERRKALASIAKDLSDATRVQVSKAVRVIETETNNAFQDGRAQEIMRKSGMEDPTVFKRPRHDACSDCIEAYLEEDKETPKLFRMSELIDNGSNIGKSRADRLPVLESFHPYCACELHWLPPGFTFGEGGKMIYAGRSLGAAS